MILVNLKYFKFERINLYKSNFMPTSAKINIRLKPLLEEPEANVSFYKNHHSS